METNSNDKKSKAAKPSAHGAVRVHKETRKRVIVDLARINKKDFGKTVHADDYMALAVSLITPEHLTRLQEQSLSNSDRFERDYKAHVAKNGHITKDAYLGKRLSGEIDTTIAPKENAAELRKNE